MVVAFIELFIWFYIVHGQLHLSMIVFNYQSYKIQIIEEIEMIKEIKTVHIIGLGAVGATYGSCMYNYDKSCIRVIIGNERLERYKKGIVINRKRYFFDLHVPKPGDTKAELVIIAVKGHHLKETIDTILPIVGHDTIILSLLNGITSEDILSQSFGRDKVLHGFTIGIDALRENNEVIFRNAGNIVFGEHYPEARGKSTLVSNFFAKANISFTISNDIYKELWRKFILNVGINQTSAILRAPYGIYQACKDAQELMALVCKEVIPLAEREGIFLSNECIAEYINIIKALTPTGKTSMLQDLEAGRKTEVESFALVVINLGKKYGIPTPLNEMLYRIIRIFEQNNSLYKHSE